MSLSDLQTVLQAQLAADGAIAVSATTLTTAGLTAAAGFDTTVQGSLKLTVPLSVKVTGKIPAPVGNQLALTGAATFLGATAAVTQVVFTLENDGTVDVLLVTTLPAGWTFATSFPQLASTLLCDLSLGSCTYLLTTAIQTDYTWESQKPALSLHKGLNFAAFMGVGGPAALLQDIIGSLKPDATLVLAGTVDCTAIDPATGVPTVALTASIAGAITAKTSFELSLPQVLVASETDSNGLPNYRLTFAATLNVNGAPFSQFQAAIMPGSPNLALAMLPSAKAITPEQIIGLIGGEDFTKSIPAPLQSIFSAVGLTSLSAQVNVKTQTVTSIGAGIGTTTPWPMGPATLDGMTLNISVLSPFAASKSVLVNFSATAEFFPSVFKGVFDFEVSSDLGDSLTIAANFTGTVSLKYLLAGISGGAFDLPSALAGISFEDFGVSFTKSGTGYDWQIYGAAQGVFQLPLDTGALDATLQVMISSTGGVKSYRLAGGLQIGEQFFDVEIDLGATEKKLVASWTDQGAPLGFGDVAHAFGFTLPAIPPDLDLGLSDASLDYHFNDNSLAFGATSQTYGQAAFASVKTGTAPNQSRLYVFCLATGGKPFSLSNLPLVGEELAKIETISVGNLQAIITSAPVTDSSAIGAINGLIQILGTGYPLLPAAGASGTVMLSASLQLGKETLPISVSLGGASQPKSGGAARALPAPAGLGQPAPARVPAPAQAAAPPGSATSGNVVWFNVQRSYGPVSIGRIGVLYQSSQQALWFEIDATLAFGPLSLSLVGLGIGSPLKSFAPEFSLQGLGVAYARPPLEIAGTLVNLAPPGADYIEFEGGVIISTSKVTLEAFGYYGNKSGFSSMFLFGDIAYPIGGPPAFFVTGAALGFGYNSNLRLPTISEVQAFPFVQVLPTSTAPNTGLFGPDPTPTKVLDVIMNTNPPWVTAQAGSLWFGTGITFTSFELVNSQAMLFVEAGDELVVALIGDARAQFPQQLGQGGSIYANIELDLEVRFAPAEGVFSVQALLASSSYLLDPACVLTGGFAFFVWYGDSPQAGDFVVTLGGYNPGFTPPSYYPVVPIVGFHWAMDSSITISGGAYFALTPAVLMVGGRLDATYQAGNLKAWFDAHADVIVRWKPFWFDANIGVVIGASYKIDLLLTTATISVELGCDLEFYGPPTGGTVTVDWYIISFTIPFGGGKQAGEAIKSWSDVEAMLPNAGPATGAAAGVGDTSHNVLSLTPVAGLTPAGATPLAAHAGGGAQRAAATPAPAAAATPWLVRGSQFAFTAATPIPATKASVGSTHSFNGATFDVFPLGWSSVSSTLTLTVTDSAGKDVSAAFEVALLRKAVPSSLWGAPPQSAGQQQVPAGGTQLVDGQITGFSLAVNPPLAGATAGPVDVHLALAAIDLELAGAVLPLSAAAQPQGDIAANPGTTISAMTNAGTGIGAASTATARGKILDSLTKLGYAPATRNDPMTKFAAAAGSLFAAEPLEVA